MKEIIEIRPKLTCPQTGTTNVHVQERVIESLRILIPYGMHDYPQNVNIYNFAVAQLCKAQSIEEIDWVGVVNLATSIASLCYVRCQNPR